MLQQIEAMRLKPERGLWRYILKGDQKMNDTHLGKYIAIRRSQMGVECIIRKGVTTHQVTALCGMLAPNVGKLYVHHRATLRFVMTVHESTAEDIARKVLPALRNREYPINLLLKFKEGHYQLFGGHLMHSNSFKRELVKHFKKYPVS